MYRKFIERKTGERVKIRCPECDGNLKFRFGPCDYYCMDCGEDFSEHEIEMRCGH